MANDSVIVLTTAPHAQPPKKRSRWRRWLLFGVGGLVLVVAVLPMLAAKLGIVNRIAQQASAKLNGNLAIGSTSLGWFSPVRLQNVTLTDRTGRTVATIPRITTSKSLIGFASNRSNLGTITIEQPSLEIVCEDSGTNLEDMVQKLVSEPSSSGDAPAIAIAVQNATVKVIDTVRNQNWTLSNVDVNANVPGTKTEPITVTVTSSGANALTADVSLGSTITAKVKTQDLPMGLVAAFARRFDPKLQLDGTLQTDLDAAYSAAANGKPLLKCTGSLGITNLDVMCDALGADRLKLTSLTMPCKIETNENGITIEQADLSCDVGTVKFAGRFDPNSSVEQWTQTPGLSAAADLELAKLVALLPNLLKLKPGTAITDGRLVATLVSSTSMKGTVWTGDVKSSALKGTNGGKPLVWDQPLGVQFVGRVTREFMPNFEKLDVTSDFGTIRGSGAMDDFTIIGDVSLDQLTVRLAQFVDVGGMQFGGNAKLNLRNKPNGRGGSSLNGDATFTNFAFQDSTRVVREPSLAMQFDLDGQFLKSETLSVNRGTATVTAGSETMHAVLFTPVNDVKSLQSAHAKATLSGDLAKWLGRAAAFAPVPKHYQLGGVGTCELSHQPNGTTVALVGKANFQNFLFSDGTNSIREPNLSLDLNATGERSGDTLSRVNTGKAVVKCGDDQAELSLLEPWTNVNNPQLAKFTATLAGQLDRWRNRVGAFVPIPKEYQLAGNANIGLTQTPSTDGSTIVAKAIIKDMAFSDGVRQFREPQVEVNANLVGQFMGGTQQVRQAKATILAGSETADVELLEPITNLATLQSGKATLKLSGDLAKWTSRAATAVTIPKDYQIAGTGPIQATIRFDPTTISLDNITADLRNAKFSGAGVKVDEPQILLDPTNVVLTRPSGVIDIPKLILRSTTIATAVENMKITPMPDGNYGITAKAVANLNLSRFQQMLQLQSDPQWGDRIDGVVSGGAVNLDTVDGKIRFRAALPIDKFVIGHPQRPTWTEDKLTVAAEGVFDLIADGLKLDTARVERPDGLKVECNGKLDKITTVQDIDISGKLTYDLAKIEPQLKNFLGQSVKVNGRDTREFKMSGRLSQGVQGVTVAVGNRSTNPFGELNGNASLAWTSLKAYGFDMGQSELKAKLDKGTLNIDPIEAAFGQTGKVRLEPTVRFLPTGSNITLAHGKIVDKAKLTPQACAEALGYALPLLARSSEAEGLVSLDLEENSIPLSAPERATMKGKLTLHSVAIGPGPLITEIATMLGAKGTKFNMNKEQVVPIKLDNGWVHHENLTISAPNFTMRTSGAVSVNGDMNLIADVPLPENEIGQLLRNNPKIREAMLNKRLQIPIRGKLGKPQLDPQGFRKEVRRIIDEVTRDAAKNALGNLLDKLGPPPKKP